MALDVRETDFSVAISALTLAMERSLLEAMLAVLLVSLVVETIEERGDFGGDFGVDDAPRFGSALRGTKKEAVVVSAFCAIGVTLLAFCDIWVFGFCSLLVNVPLPNILFLSKF